MKISNGTSAASPVITHQATITQQEKAQMGTEKLPTPSLKVSISKEGREYYRRSVSQMEHDSYDDVLQRREQLKDVRFVNLNYGGELSRTAARFNAEAAEVLSTRDKADNYVKAYAKLYDEIVQGYENGTREVCVEDENGFRILTQDEELNALDTAYKKLVDDFAVMEQATKQADEIVRKEMEKTAQISKNPTRAITYLEEQASRKKENIPENLADKMINAVTLFKADYVLLRPNADRLTQLWSDLKITW